MWGLNKCIYSNQALLRVFVVCSLFASCSTAFAAEIKNSWLVLGGGGSSKIGWGNTNQKVETLDILIRQQRPQALTRGSGKWINRKSVLIEIPVSWIYTPDKALMVGLTFNAAWHFIANPKYQPYVFIGGGPAYTRAEIPGTSLNLKGTYQIGAGFEFISGNSQLGSRRFIELRYHHVSNGGLEKPNDSINSLKLLFGFNFR